MTEMYRKTPSLMERVVTRENMEAAIKSVKRNKGAAGIDGMTVFEMKNTSMSIIFLYGINYLMGLINPNRLNG